jgi:hypothetical protein
LFVIFPVRTKFLRLLTLPAADIGKIDVPYAPVNAVAAA